MQTIYFTALKAAQVGNYNHVILPNTTLNEKYNVGVPGVVKNPIVKYFGIGLKSGVEVTTDGVYNFTQDTHEGKDGNVFIPLPIRLVQLDVDMPDSEKINYRMRKQMTIDGVEYVAYYLKILKDVNSASFLEVTMDSNNNGIISRWSTTDSTILSPIPKRNTVPTTQDNFKAIAYSKPYTMPLSTDDLTSMTNAAKLLYNLDDPEIGEYMVCTGVETTEGDGSVEVSGCQAAVFINQLVKIKTYLNVGYDYVFELGGLEMMKVES